MIKAVRDRECQISCCQGLTKERLVPSFHDASYSILVHWYLVHFFLAHYSLPECQANCQQKRIITWWIEKERKQLNKHIKPKDVINKKKNNYFFNLRGQTWYGHRTDGQKRNQWLRLGTTVRETCNGNDIITSSKDIMSREKK